MNFGSFKINEKVFVNKDSKKKAGSSGIVVKVTKNGWHTVLVGTEEYKFRTTQLNTGKIQKKRTKKNKTSKKKRTSKRKKRKRTSKKGRTSKKRTSKRKKNVVENFLRDIDIGIVTSPKIKLKKSIKGIHFKKNKKLKEYLKSFDVPLENSFKYKGGHEALVLGLMIYLLRKHRRQMCTPVSKHGEFEIHWTCVEKDRMLLFPENFQENFYKCKSKKRFIIIPIWLYQNKCGKDKDSHSNMMIYDSKYETLEHFEPYGSSNSYDRNLFEQEIFREFVETGMVKKYLPNNKLCPYIGPQSKESSEKPRRIHHGFCTIWSFWYADLRLSFPDIDPKKLLKMAMTRLGGPGGSGFYNQIVGYTKFIINYLRILKQRNKKMLVKYRKNNVTNRDNDGKKEADILLFEKLLKSELAK